MTPTAPTAPTPASNQVLAVVVAVAPVRRCVCVTASALLRRLLCHHRRVVSPILRHSSLSPLCRERRLCCVWLACALTLCCAVEPDCGCGCSTLPPRTAVVPVLRLVVGIRVVVCWVCCGCAVAAPAAADACVSSVVKRLAQPWVTCVGVWVWVYGCVRE